MNGLVIVLIGIVALGAGYLFYGRWLANKWGIDPNAKTPAYTHEDGEDYVPSSKFTVFSHQFSSIAGAGPVTGPILASVFGWVPVLLWLILGGLFFGAVQDFGALYASVKNEGKSMGMIIEKYIGRTGRKLFMLFCWLFTLLVIAAFTDMVAGTFVGKGAEVEGLDAAVTYAHSTAATISMLFIVVAVIFGLIQKKIGKMNEIVRAVVAIALLVVMFAIGMKLPIYATKSAWIYIIMAYLFLASVMPMWLLMQPRDYMTTFMLLGMIIGAVVGVVVAHPSMQLNAFNGFSVVDAAGAKSYLFPTLFVTIACGAVSGFHSLVSSGTSSKTISNEKDMPMVGYGAMVVESLLGIVALVVVGAVAVGGTKPDGTPFAIFSSGVAGFLEKLGVPVHVATVFRPYLTNYLKDGRLELSNNRAERSIKPFVIDRKNFLFANTPKGAKGSAIMFSLIQTAIENGLDPYKYLTWLLKDANNADLTQAEEIQKLLPWNALAGCGAK